MTRSRNVRHALFLGGAFCAAQLTGCDAGSEASGTATGTATNTGIGTSPVGTTPVGTNTYASTGTGTTTGVATGTGTGTGTGTKTGVGTGTGTGTGTGVGGATGVGGTKTTGGTTAKGGSTSKGGTTSTGGTKATGGTPAATGGNSGGPTVSRLTNGQDGKTTRFWDCCKPSCGWKENVSGKNPTKTCNQDGTSTADAKTQSSCGGGGAFQCYSFAPWSVSSTLSYGFAASHTNGNCGKCYQLDFTGAGDNNNASALSTKTMIVQIINIGGDVGSTQFDLLIPGGGVGQFNACSNQWGIGNDKLGAQYGGFLTTCGASMSCITSMCQAAFGSKPDLMAGCNWFTSWFNGASNPKVKYAEVSCPSAISSKSGM